MCLGIPGQVVEIVDGFAGQLALVDVEGARRRVNIGMLDDPPGPGTWVLIHLGFAVEIIEAAEAAHAMAGLELIGQARRLRRRYTVLGLVQGVGFRPFAYATAAALALSGSVANTPDGVLIEVEGDADAGPVIRQVARDVLGGVPAPVVAARFHAAVAALIVHLAELGRDETGLGVVVLGGGVFQNALLLGAAVGDLGRRGFTVLRPRLLPPNDGGIALGQLVIGASA